MSALKVLLTQVEAFGASFLLREGDELVVQAPEPLPAALIAELRQQKAAIVAAFKSRCGWCQSMTLCHADTGLGRVFCLSCHTVYNPSTGRWHPGERAKRRLTSDPGADAA